MATADLQNLSNLPDRTHNEVIDQYHVSTSSSHHNIFLASLNTGTLRCSAVGLQCIGDKSDAIPRLRPGLRLQLHVNITKIPKFYELAVMLHIALWFPSSHVNRQILGSESSSREKRCLEMWIEYCYVECHSWCLAGIELSTRGSIERQLTEVFCFRNLFDESPENLHWYLWKMYARQFTS